MISLISLMMLKGVLESTLDGEVFVVVVVVIDVDVDVDDNDDDCEAAFFGIALAAIAKGGAD